MRRYLSPPPTEPVHPKRSRSTALGKYWKLDGSGRFAFF
jgi:hypothetical protein